MNKTTIFLLIDDDEDDRELFRLALSDADEDACFYEAKSGREALERLEKKEIVPDYIFLDLNMPEMNGKECLKELRSLPECYEIPVIIFSTSANPDDIRDTINNGASDFLTKPAKTSELTLFLSVLMKGSVYNKQI